VASDRFEEIVDDFAFLEDWEDRYRYVIDLGRAMPPLEDALKSPATKVEGCASQVWILPRLEGAGRTARFDFRGDSDAMIVRGLIAVLHALYAGLDPKAVLAVDAPQVQAQRRNRAAGPAATADRRATRRDRQRRSNSRAPAHRHGAATRFS
jgi:cysteine desulfuration protein SufE